MAVPVVTLMIIMITDIEMTLKVVTLMMIMMITDTEMAVPVVTDDNNDDN